ncbi:hypothetical protein KP509_10G067900 [Ceratopteris richardii]|nr:hypothetical protein KP509_10G067900 [Ceratopteris richardii]
MYSCTTVAQTCTIRYMDLGGFSCMTIAKTFCKHIVQDGLFLLRCLMLYCPSKMFPLRGNKLIEKIHVYGSISPSSKLGAIVYPYQWTPHYNKLLSCEEK